MTVTTAGDDENRVRRYDAAGTPAWTRQLPLTGLDGGAHGGAVRCDGVLLLTGSTELPPDPAGEWGMRKDLWLAAFGADGGELWSTLHRFGTPDSYGEGHRLAAAYDGDAIVVGSFLAPSGGTYLPWLGRFTGG